MHNPFIAPCFKAITRRLRIVMYVHPVMSEWENLAGEYVLSASMLRTKP